MSKPQTRSSRPYESLTHNPSSHPFHLTIAFTMLAVLSLVVSSLFLPQIVSAVGSLGIRGASKDPYGGKILTPTNYTVVTGIFIQDSPGFNSTGYDLLSDSFGLINKSLNRWTNFTNYIANLNKNADEYTTYKVVYIARHGEGYHNLAETIYGTPAWNCFFAMQYTDGNITWGPDALLTPAGIAQAEAVNAAWKQQLADGVPLPQKLYSSPMRRSASTLNITWSDVLLNKDVVPNIKEDLREAIGLHTCDQRSNKTVLRSTYPNYHFDPAFTEHDEQWNPIYEEQSDQQALRTRLLLNEIFSEDPSTFISITAHSGTITGFFKAVGHQLFGVQTGGFVPVVIKAVSYPTATMDVIVGGQSGTAPVCTGDPTTAVKSPATVTARVTWYPACATLPSESISSAVAGCLAFPVTGSSSVLYNGN